MKKDLMKVSSNVFELQKKVEKELLDYYKNSKLTIIHYGSNSKKLFIEYRAMKNRFFYGGDTLTFLLGHLIFKRLKKLGHKVEWNYSIHETIRVYL